MSGYHVYLKELSPEEIEDAQFKQVSSSKTLVENVCNIKNCTNGERFFSGLPGMDSIFLATCKK